MASGKFAAVVLTGIVDELVYTVPASVVDTANIRLSNPTSAAINVSVNIGTGSGSVAADLVVPTQSIAAKGVMDETGFVMSAGEKIFVTSSAAGIVVRVNGHEV